MSAMLYWLHLDDDILTVDAPFRTVEAFAAHVASADIVTVDEISAEPDNEGRLVHVRRKRVAVAKDRVRKIEFLRCPEPKPLAPGEEW